MTSRDPIQRRGAEVLTDPTVSVIVPAYGTANFINETLESVFAQTYPNFETIVVNDGAPDTEEIEQAIAPFLERIVYIRQENRGLSGARNTAIRASRGRYIALLDSDDAWLPRYLEATIRALEADVNLDAVFPNVVTFGGSIEDGRIAMDERPLHGDITFERLISDECWVYVGVTARKNAIERLGLFDETLRSVEDYDLWLRLLHAEGRIGYLPEVLARYRKRPDSLSADPVWMFETQLEVFDKLARSLDLTPHQVQLLQDRRRRTTALLSMCEGKRAFFRGEMDAAVKALSESNLVLRDWKLALIIALLKLMPFSLLRLYRLRDRLVFRTSTEF